MTKPNNTSAVPLPSSDAPTRCRHIEKAGGAPCEDYLCDYCHPAALPSSDAAGAREADSELTVEEDAGRLHIIEWLSDKPESWKASVRAYIARLSSAPAAREEDRDGWEPDICPACGGCDWQCPRDLSFTYCGKCGTRAGGSREGEPSDRELLDLVMTGLRSKDGTAFPDLSIRDLALSHWHSARSRGAGASEESK